MHTVEKSDKDHRKGGVVRGNGISQYLQAEIDRCLIGENPIWVSISEVITALGSEPGWSKNIDYF